MTELCATFGISRKTGYKYLKRYQEEGPEALRDRSRAPHRHPNQTSGEIEAAVLRVRKAHPTWGSKKIRAVLERERETDELPARSTVDAILARAGLVRPRKCRNRLLPRSGPPVVEAVEPNDAWSIDFKGWFRVGDGTRCDPLTVNDVATRASLELQAMVAPKLEDVQSRLTALF
jgi:transposase